MGSLQSLQIYQYCQYRVGYGERGGGLLRRDMETALVDFVFYPAAVVLPHVAQHFAQYPFQRVVAHHAAALAWGFYCLVAVVGDVKGGAIHVAAVLCGVGISFAEMGHILLATQHAGHDNLVERHSLGLKAVEEGAAYVLQEH